MNSHEIVRRTLDFEHPERVAISFLPSDFAWGAPQLAIPEAEWQPAGGGAWERKDEWGNTWRRLDTTSKGEVGRGALEDLALVDSFPIPDFAAPEAYTSAAEIFRAQANRWRIGSIHGFTFSIARKLRRMEQYLMDLILEPQRIRRLHDRVDEQICHQIEAMARAGADCIMIAEDWGTQRQLLIHPRLWRQEFGPRCAGLCAFAHGQGLRVFMHSCGKMTEIIPDLIAAGVDLLQFDQPAIHGIDTLRAFQDENRITFWCPVDIQTTLQTKDERQIRAAARALIEQLWRGRGGFVAGFYADEASIGLEPEWQQIACEEFLKWGK